MSILVAATDPLGTTGDAVPSIGWEGFLDLQGMVDEITALVLATLLALIIAFHPTTQRTVDTIEEAELPKHHRATQSEKLVIAASSLGTVFEWYDFFIY